MIDLDQPAQHRPPPNGTSAGRWRRFAAARTLILAAVGLFLAGVALGGVLMDSWRYQPLAASVERADQAVAVVLFAAPGATSVLNDERRVRIEAQVTVVNAGPQPVSVLAVHVDQPGVTVRSPERERQIAPGTALPLDVVVEWDCAAAEPQALVASVSVETVDEQLRTVSPVALDGAPWLVSRRGGCASTG